MYDGGLPRPNREYTCSGRSRIMKRGFCILKSLKSRVPRGHGPVFTYTQTALKGGLHGTLRTPVDLPLTCD